MKVLLLIIFSIFCNCTEMQKNTRVQTIQIRHPECCNKTIKANTGDTLMFSFTEYPGRAYTWMPQKLNSSDIIFYLYEKRTQLSTKDDAPETADYYFLCKKSGEITLTFRYVRPWEINKAATDSCAVSIVILYDKKNKS